MLAVLHVSSPYPNSKVHGTNVGPIWGRQDPDEPHVGPMNLAIWVATVIRIRRGDSKYCLNHAWHNTHSQPHAKELCIIGLNSNEYPMIIVSIRLFIICSIFKIFAKLCQKSLIRWKWQYIYHQTLHSAKNLSLWYSGITGIVGKNKIKWGALCDNLFSSNVAQPWWNLNPRPSKDIKPNTKFRCWEPFWVKSLANI